MGCCILMDVWYNKAYIFVFLGGGRGLQFNWYMCFLDKDWRKWE